MIIYEYIPVYMRFCVCLIVIIGILYPAGRHVPTFKQVVAEMRSRPRSQQIDGLRTTIATIDTWCPLPWWCENVYLDLIESEEAQRARTLLLEFRLLRIKEAVRKTFLVPITLTDDEQNDSKQNEQDQQQNDVQLASDEQNESKQGQRADDAEDDDYDDDADEDDEDEQDVDIQAQEAVHDKQSGIESNDVVYSPPSKRQRRIEDV